MDVADRSRAGITLAGKPMTTAEILANAEALMPQLAAAVGACDELGHLPAPLMEALRAAGVFRIGFPGYLGGPDMGLADQTRLIDLLSQANPSAGWSVMILADSGYFAGMVDPAVAAAVWPRLDMATSAVSRPPARAVKVDGGYRLSGSYYFTSGIYNADRLSVQCTREIDGQPVLLDNGEPEVCLAFVPLDRVTIHDAWDTIGLRGTGSTKITVDDAFLPEAHVFARSIEVPDFSAAPLSRYVNLMFVNQLGVILGTTRGLIAAIEAILRRKKMPDGSMLSEQYRFKVGLMHALGLLDAASSYVYGIARQCDALLYADKPVPFDLLAGVQTMSVVAAELCRQAADEALEILGSDHVFRSNGIDRLYGDLRVALTHVIHRKEVLQRASAWRDRAAAAA